VACSAIPRRSGTSTGSEDSRIYKDDIYIILSGGSRILPQGMPQKNLLCNSVKPYSNSVKTTYTK
jgi:hypothetical protein